MDKEKMFRFKVRILADFFTAAGTTRAYTGEYVAKKLLTILPDMDKISEDNPGAPYTKAEYIHYITDESEFADVCECGKIHLDVPFIAEVIAAKDAFVYELMAELKKALTRALKF